MMLYLRAIWMVITKMINQEKLLKYFTVMLIIAGAYWLGRHHANENHQLEMAERQQEVQAISQANLQDQIQTNQRLSVTVTKLTDKREEDHENINNQRDALVSRFTNDSVPITIKSDLADRIKYRRPDVRPTTKTVVVKIPSVWGFSPSDRRFILEEAARADKTAAELKLCKAFVEELYQNHEQHNQKVRAYQKHISRK